MYGSTLVSTHDIQVIASLQRELAEVREQLQRSEIARQLSEEQSGTEAETHKQAMIDKEALIQELQQVNPCCIL